MRVLVLGASGMLGNAMFRVLSESAALSVFGTLRSPEAESFFSPPLRERLLSVKDLEDPAELAELFATVRPQVLINCTSLRKSVPLDPMRAIELYSLLPQRLAQLCGLNGARLIQISSDAVFSGSRGRYREDDLPDPIDIYGLAKLLGEVRDPHALTLRTSMIGPELQTKTGLLEWFLGQSGQCRCYRRAIFSGFPTVVLAQLIRDVVLPRQSLSGTYHIATRAISKYDLLSLVAREYGKDIDIVPDDSMAIDRSLVADRFEQATGYVLPDWPELVHIMRSYRFGLARP